MIKNNRLKYIDVAKGIAMLCIVLGHLGIPQITQIVFTFHVPVFFFITGYFIRQNTSRKVYIQKKFRTLIIPYIYTCLIIVLLAVFFNELFSGGVGSKEIALSWIGAALYGAGGRIKPFYLKGIGAIWFLLATFWGTVFLRCIILEIKKGYRIAAVLISFLLSYWSCNLFWFPFSIQAGVCAILFMYFGYLLNDLLPLFRKLSMEIRVVLTILALFVWIGFVRDFQTFWLVQCDFGRGIIDIVGCICGCYIIILLSYYIEKRNKYLTEIFSFLGRYSIFVLCIHLIELNLFPWPLFTNFLYKYGMPEYMALFAIIIGKFVWIISGTFICSKCNLIRSLYGYSKINHTDEYTDKHIEENKLVSVQKENKRILYWDIAKGIVINLVILGHISSLNLTVIRAIFSFHMPFFFIANAYFIKNYNVKENMQKCVRSLLIPYCIVCLLAAILCTNQNISDLPNYSIFLQCIIDMLAGMSKISNHFQNVQSVWLVWFVICLFAARMVYICIMNFICKWPEVFQLILFVVMATIGGYIGGQYVFLPWSFDLALVALPLMWFGDFCHRRNILKERNCWLILGISVVIWGVGFKSDIWIEMAERS